ncbi:hypothetical protein D3C87_1607130 [compost metagenome]
MKEDLDDAHARQGLGFDVLDVIDTVGERALIAGDDALRHVLRGQAVVAPHHAHDRNVDRREDVGRRAQDGNRPGQQDQYCQNDEGIRPT